MRITDRAKDIIKVGGEWLSSLELEDILVVAPGGGRGGRDRPARRQVGRGPARRWSCSSPAHEVTEKDLRAHVKSFITAGVLPREAVLTAVQFVEAIDRTGVGKINKVALRAKYLR